MYVKTEAALRRDAHKQGMKLHKIHGRDDEYFLTDSNLALIFPHEYGMIGNGASLEDIQGYLY